MIAIVLLCRSRPPDHIISFYRQFIDQGYHVYLLPDAGDKLTEISGIQIISIDDAVAAEAGYYDFTISFKKPSRAMAWDKALYFFSRIESEYEYVWFIEDDVFIPSERILQQIDLAHPTADLISKDNIINTTGELDSWYWWKYVPSDLLPPPWSRSLVCATRLSRKLLYCLDQLIITSGQMLHIDTAPLRSQPFRAPFIEFMFHTLSLARGLDIVTPKQLSHITWRREWKLNEISMDHITHPIKDFLLHEVIRTNNLDTDRTE